MAEQRSGGRTPMIAVGLAVVALVTVAIAVIVVASRAARPWRRRSLRGSEDRGPLKHRLLVSFSLFVDPCV